MRLLSAALIFFAFAWWLPLPNSGPTMADLDPTKVRLGLALFACIAVLWMSEALPLAITALLVPVLGALFGLCSLAGALAAFAQPPIYLFFGGFALASALAAQGLDRWLAQSLARAGRGHFGAVALLLFAGTAALSMWMSNTATVAMMVPLALGILGQLRLEGSAVQANERFVLLGLAYAASIGGLGTIIGSPPNGIAARALGLSFADWLKLGLPMVAVLLPMMALLLIVLFRPELAARVELENEKFTLTGKRMATLVIFAITAALWICGSQVRAVVPLPAELDAWVALAAVVALVACRVVSWQQVEAGTQWGVLLLFGGGLALSGILETSGASTFLARVLTQSLAGMPLWLMLTGIVGFVIFLTELSSNTAIAALLTPIFLSVASGFAVAPATLVLPMAMAASCAFMMPVATPPNAIVFASGRIPQHIMMSRGLVLNLVFVPVIVALTLLVY